MGAADPRTAEPKGEAYPFRMARPCHVVRVFTRGDQGGNHLGVVNDVVGVSDEQMQAIATELGFSETVFVDWVDPFVDPRVRIFTPVEELPFAGHPLVGTAWVLSMLGPGATGIIGTSVGPVTYTAVDEVVTITCEIPIDVLDAGDVLAAAAAAGMPEPIFAVHLGLPKAYLIGEYATFGDVAGLEPDMDGLRSHFSFMAYARDGDMVKARFFAPASGVDEDPATGSAAVALARAFTLRGEAEGAVTVLQGDEIGHPSTIELSWNGTSASIGGTVRRDEVVLVS